MADPNNWTEWRSSQPSTGIAASYQQPGQTNSQPQTSPKPGMIPPVGSNISPSQQHHVGSSIQPNIGMGQRPPDSQTGGQFQPPGHVSGGPRQPVGTVHPQMQSHQSMPTVNYGHGSAPPIVNGLPRPALPQNGHKQPPLGGQAQQFTQHPFASRQNQGTPVMSNQMAPTPGTLNEPPHSGYNQQPALPVATSSDASSSPVVQSLVPQSSSQVPQATQMSNSRPNELPLPYHGHGQYSHQVSNLTSSATPGLTPNSSEPPSQKSSRAPSPVCGQKYDALEGQFSPQDGKQGSHPIPTSQEYQPPRPFVPKSVQQQPPRLPGTTAQNLRMLRQYTPPSAVSGQSSPYPGPSRHSAPPSGVLGHPPAPGGSGEPPQPPGGSDQPLPPAGGSVQPLPPAGGSGQPLPPPRGSGQPLPPPGGSGQPLPPPGGSGQPLSPPGGQPLPPPGGSGQPLPPPGGSGQPLPPPGGQPLPPPGGSGQPLPPPGGSGQPLPPPGGSGQPPRPTVGSSQPLPPPGGSSQIPPPPGGPGQLPPFSGTSGQQPTAQLSPGSGSVTNTHPSMIQSTPAGITGPRQYSQMTTMGPSALPRPAVPTYSVNSTLPGSSLPGAAYPANSTYSHTTNTTKLSSSFSNMKLQPDNLRPVNLLQERTLIPPEGVEVARPDLPLEYKKANCSPDIFRCTLNSIPNTESLLNKSRLPLGILIHPFKDLAQLPVIQSSVIVRCRSCRTYINPFVTFIDSRRWRCNLCYRNNELPEEFNYDPVSRTYGEPQRRPEIKSGTIEFIAPSEYMLRPPQPAAYLFVLDVSFNAKGTGYLQSFCQTLLDELDRLPGDARTQIGFIAFDRSLYYFSLGEGLSQPQLLVVSDIDEIFLPAPDNLLVNLNECKDLVIELLNILPDMFKDNMETGSALGPAIEAAFKLLSPTGGRISVFQTQLPTVGSGSLKSREDPNERSGKKIQHLGPATDFYKQLALNCSAQQVAVDLFMFNSQYADIASIACVSKYSGGSLYYFPGYHSVTNPTEADKFESVLKRYLTRKIGFEAVMRIRCSRGLSIHTFHGNFFVRSTDLLSLPNVNPDAGFGMQMSIEDTIEANYVCFQAALLYTSSKGERRIRVHTLAVPVAKTLSEVHANADQQAIIGLLAKMAVDRSLSASMGDARDAMLNAVKDMLNAYGSTLTTSQKIGQLPCPYSLRLQPMYTLAMLKSMAFRVGSSTKLDDRVFAMEQCKNLPLTYLMLMLYPNMYPLHSVDDKNIISKGDLVIPQLPVIQLSSAHMDRHGVYLLDTGSHMIIWVGAAISDQFCQDVFDRPQFSSLPDAMLEIPNKDNETSELIRTFIVYLNDQRPFPATLLILREDSRSRHLFLQYLIEDHTESTMSYYEFLQHLQKELKS